MYFLINTDMRFIAILYKRQFLIRSKNKKQTNKKAFNIRKMVEEYFMGMPSSAFFKADLKMALVIACSQYD